jgi:hypothetical protein
LDVFGRTSARRGAEEVVVFMEALKEPESDFIPLQCRGREASQSLELQESVDGDFP